MKTKYLSVIVLATLLTPAVHAASRASFSYAVTTETVNAAGRTTVSAAYTNDSSLGGIGGTAASPDPSLTVRHGYPGQLYEITGVRLDAPALLGSNTIDEGASVQYYAWALLDDGTSFPLPGSEMMWAIFGPPVISVDAQGLVSTGPVFTNTGGLVQCGYQQHGRSRLLIVRDVDPDNYGSYAGDGLPDFWQVYYFGENKTNAAPASDPDHDGQSNLYEYITGTDPTNAASRFQLTIDGVNGQPTRKLLTFSPRFTNRTYTVEFKSDLNINTAFTALTNFVPESNGPISQIVDTNATQAIKFYRVKVSLP